MRNLIRVRRRTKKDCIVCIMLDRATNKYCYVNLTSQHVCKCRFDTFEMALADLLEREDVVSYELIKNGEIGKEEDSTKDPLAEALKIDPLEFDPIRERDEALGYGTFAKTKGLYGQGNETTNH